jgi:hypothetical protein
MAGALLNARLDRLFGVDYIVAFLRAAESGSLEKLRQSLLYLDQSGARLHTPANYSKHEAGRRVALAGELLAEVGGVEPPTWQRLLEAVQELERTCGLQWR